MRRRPSGGFLVSVAFHTALAIVLANVVLHYDIVFERGPRPPAPQHEEIAYVTVSPPAGALGGTTATTPAKATEPARRLVAPSRVPSAVVPPAPTAPAAGGTPGGVEGGTGVGGGSGPTTGIVPAEPDPRLATDGKFFYPAYKTPAQRADSAVKATILAYNDSIDGRRRRREAEAGRLDVRRATERSGASTAARSISGSSGSRAPCWPRCRSASRATLARRSPTVSSPTSARRRDAPRRVAVPRRRVQGRREAHPRAEGPRAAREEGAGRAGARRGTDVEREPQPRAERSRRVSAARSRARGSASAARSAP